MAAVKPQQAFSTQAERTEAQGVSSTGFKCRQHPAPRGEQLERLWASLPGGATTTPFQTIGFLEAFQRNMLNSCGDRFDVYEMYREGSGEPVMLLPVHTRRRGPLRVASLPDLGLADQCGPVIARGSDLTDLESTTLWKIFTSSLKNVDVLAFKNIVPVLGPQLNPLYGLACARDDQPMLMLAMAPEGEQESWSKRPVFKEVRQKERKLSAEGVRFQEASSHEERLQTLHMIREQRRLRFEAMGRVNTLEFPGRMDFYRDIANEGGADRNVVFLTLRTDTEIVAAIMAFVTKDMINGVLIGMGDERWHRLSPGVVLFARTIEWAKTNGIKQFSFGTGMQGYKQRFGPQEVRLRRILIPLTQLGGSIVKLRQLTEAVQNLLRPPAEA